MELKQSSWLKYKCCASSLLLCLHICQFIVVQHPKIHALCSVEAQYAVTVVIPQKKVPCSPQTIFTRHSNRDIWATFDRVPPNGKRGQLLLSLLWIYELWRFSIGKHFFWSLYVLDIVSVLSLPNGLVGWGSGAVAGIWQSDSHIFPSPCTSDVGESVLEFPTLLLQVDPSVNLKRQQQSQRWMCFRPSILLLFHTRQASGEG